MPMLENTRHERFAQELARGKSASEAYATAGYAKNDGNAGRLNRNEQVLKRVAELQARSAEGLNVTVQWLTEKAEEARKQAMEMGQNSAAVSAIKELGILAGLRVEKRETTTKTLSEMTDDELMAIAKGDEARSMH